MKARNLVFYLIFWSRYGKTTKNYAADPGFADAAPCSIDEATLLACNCLPLRSVLFGNDPAFSRNA